MTSRWAGIQEKAFRNERLTTEEALGIVRSSDQELLDVAAAAFDVRRRFFEQRVKLNYLVNIKSGLCSENCSYCSQSGISQADIPSYPLLSSEEIIACVDRGVAVGAARACLVASGRNPSEREIDSIICSVRSLKEKYPRLEICTSLGFLEEAQATRLKEAGVFAYNHNINTSESYYGKICDSHTYQDRLRTLERAKRAGLSGCSGVLTGMGETDEDLVSMAFTLRDKNADSIPVNFLMPMEGTLLEGVNHLSPQRCLRILALFRFVNPSVELRIAGGREIHLRTLQPLGLMIANCIFIGDYLTTPGQSPRADLEMIRDLGFQVVGQPDDFIERALDQLAFDAEKRSFSLA